MNVKQLWRKLYFRINPKMKPTENLMYRVHLFTELTQFAKNNQFAGKRILEIGPKDGRDSARLASLNPQELVMIDLPEKRKGNLPWLENLTCPHQYIEANFLYMSAEEQSSLGKFDLIWFTGVLYHNAEQLRLLRKLYKMLNLNGCLVLESATFRGPAFFRQGAFVQIHYPETYRNTGTVTHLPTANAIKSWLKMVGFTKINDSNCYKPHDFHLIGTRYACIAHKQSSGEEDVYYGKSGLNPKYHFGDST